ncbi:hypothetical protein, partial [Bifidobacterium pseudocatenulatum]|uniref:hypothetical protein n=1 Tax=Bifidobacterium pseudocatenulatum TaxID=28026 RepID=UPI00321BA5AA
DTVQIERSGCSGTSADSEHLYSITHRSRPKRNFDPVNKLFRVFAEGGIDLRYGRLSGCENVAKVIFNEVKVV